MIRIVGLVVRERRVALSVSNGMLVVSFLNEASLTYFYFWFGFVDILHA